jgi:ribosomal-protein-alanine N-acetyltransferase
VIAPRLADASGLPALPGRRWAATGSGFDRHAGCAMPTGSRSRCVSRATCARRRDRAHRRAPLRRGGGVAAERPRPYTCATRWPSPPKRGVAEGERGSDPAAALPPHAGRRPRRCRGAGEIALRVSWSLGNFRDSVTAGYDCWVITHGESVIGYAVLMVALDEAHLLNFAVAAEWHNQGIGRGFLRHMVEVAAWPAARSSTSRCGLQPRRAPPLSHRRFPADRHPPDYYPARSGARGRALPGPVVVVDARSLKELELLSVALLYGLEEEASVTPGPSQQESPGVQSSPPVQSPVPFHRAHKANWDELRTLTAECRACGLCEQRKQAVLGVGSLTGPWLFVGEVRAPTRTSRASRSSGRRGPPRQACSPRSLRAGATRTSPTS